MRRTDVTEALHDRVEELTGRDVEVVDRRSTREDHVVDGDACLSEVRDDFRDDFRRVRGSGEELVVAVRRGTADHWVSDVDAAVVGGEGFGDLRVRNVGTAVVAESATANVHLESVDEAVVVAGGDVSTTLVDCGDVAVLGGGAGSVEARKVDRLGTDTDHPTTSRRATGGSDPVALAAGMDLKGLPDLLEATIEQADAVCDCCGVAAAAQEAFARAGRTADGTGTGTDTGDEGWVPADRRDSLVESIDRPETRTGDGEFELE